MFSGLSLLWKRFSPLEEQLLSAARGVLPRQAQLIFDAQVAAINHVQRLPPSWGEINLYRLKRRRPDWAGVPMFPRADEFALAEVRFQVGDRRYDAVLSSISGHVFDFATTPGPKDIAFERWDSEPAAVLLGDPLRGPPADQEPQHLPEEWRRFLARYADRPPEGWILHDASSAHEIVVDDARYLILAERDGAQFVLHRVEPPDERLHYLAHHDGTPRPLGREPTR